MTVRRAREIPSIPTIDQQRENLRRLLEFGMNPTPGRTNFGAMLMMSPPGDVSFLAPIAPELRGVEIVSASAPKGDGRDYDIWKRPSHGVPRIIETDLTAAEVFEWLRKRHHHSEADYMKHGAKWASRVMAFYKIPKAEGYLRDLDSDQ